ncbi:MAG: hypothetical protein JWM58_4167 [Rhizobium sp.]|nr:hypothetical protein [Rhizobium sp.]
MLRLTKIKFNPHRMGRAPRCKVCGTLSARRGKIASWPVSRVLYGSGLLRSVAAIHLGRRLRAVSRNPPGQRTRKRVWRLRARAVPIRSCSRRGLPCRLCCQIRGELLPHLFTLTRQAGRFVFCGTFPRVAPAGRYPAPCFRGARTFLTLRPFDHCKARLPSQLAGTP